MNKAEIIASHPDFPWLDANNSDAVQTLLWRIGFLNSNGRVLSCGKGGEGNMNLTLRVRISDGRGEQTVMVKQSRPWVEKYDFIAAPWDRAVTELRFYERVGSIPSVAGRMPKLLGADPESRVLILEDLSPARDLSSVYRDASLDDAVLRDLANYLRDLHSATRGITDRTFANREMRQLNHQHIYEIPLQENNGLDLRSIEPTLEIAARSLRADKEYSRLVHDTGQRYLADGNCLLHGDYFPGSWLATNIGVRVIDPEFCFVGDSEFDVGVATAHLRLARQPWARAEQFLRAYDETSLNRERISRYAACEVMRRLIGYAQLPLKPGAWRADLLHASHRATRTGKLEDLWDA